MRIQLQFHTTTLEGAWLIDLERRSDSRGFFARTFCVQEFATHGLETNYPQHSISFSARRGTVRGMHYQREPHSEVKLVRCLKGSIWDVIIDMRPNSPTYPGGKVSISRTLMDASSTFRRDLPTVSRRSATV